MKQVVIAAESYNVGQVWATAQAILCDVERGQSLPLALVNSRQAQQTVTFILGARVGLVQKKYPGGIHVDTTVC